MSTSEAVILSRDTSESERSDSPQSETLSSETLWDLHPARRQARRATLPGSQSAASLRWHDRFVERPMQGGSRKLSGGRRAFQIVERVKPHSRHGTSHGLASSRDAKQRGKPGQMAAQLTGDGVVRWERPRRPTRFTPGKRGCQRIIGPMPWPQVHHDGQLPDLRQTT
jgi:hypothetical protein